ncbi:hypothetical protein A3C96_02705 [Candidatus Uhrbacteria bacterium RIFCSPHIGHO2_02_FULL_60_10]|uniref:HD domain-containing protein n=1 Tax=Candidatus Uhrbacteria bacterium RIFCSPHIGHO2_02_FULL_60_10 TaxID=1802392 RepID=A0A1F7U6Q8_9BACT|nr:MAG: hypothetical protein A3C96_02705 [Candidatus Uhrbacteria bacterium RIFCSPHIGHO2_02_FULL_60_10]
MGHKPEQSLIDKMGEYLAADRRLSWLGPLREKFPSAEWYLVGGGVRDLLMGREGRIKDYDMVVRRASLDELTSVLEKAGRVDLVGRNFGVLKFTPDGLPAGDEAVDIAWPRTEQAGMSGGYRDFQVQADADLPIEKDLARRDFTVNAIAYDFASRRLVDPHGGLRDIEERRLRAVGDPTERFREDYSRMLRALRQACQLGFDIEPRTWEALRQLMPHLDDKRVATTPRGEIKERVVPHETVAKELVKALAHDPRRALELFERSGALFRIMPELAPLVGCEQPRNHHSEGDVWTHTKLAIDKLTGPGFAEMFPGEKPTVETVLAVLLHDVAKPQTRGADENGKINFYGHAEQGARIAQGLAEHWRLASAAGFDIDAERLGWLVNMHMVPHLLDLKTVRKTTLSKHFLEQPGLGRELLHVAYADAAATIPENGEPDLSRLSELMAVLKEMEGTFAQDKKKPAKLLSGKEVMEIAHVDEGPAVGALLEALKEAQFNHQVASVEEARQLIQELAKKK